MTRDEKNLLLTVARVLRDVLNGGYVEGRDADLHDLNMVLETWEKTPPHDNCNHVWEYCGPVRRKWWQFWVGEELSWFRCSRCDEEIKDRMPRLTND